MLLLNAERIRALAPMSCVVECLEQAFRSDFSVPARQIIDAPGAPGRRFLFMPAFRADGSGTVKLVTIFPDNPARGLPTIQGAIVVFSQSGIPSAVLDASAITHLRTGAASALASRFLSREDSAHLVLIGTGALAPAMAEAHCVVRPIRRISVCGRNLDRAAATADAIRSRVGRDVDVHLSSSTDASIATADIVSCATSSSAPVVAGRCLRPGTFVDLVGSFSPSHREADDDVVSRARIFVDTYEGALSEAGDLLDPLARGIIERERVEGELADLVRGRVQGRRTRDEITLFKSVGTAIEDLATAHLVVERAMEAPEVANSMA